MRSILRLWSLLDSKTKKRTPILLVMMIVGSTLEGISIGMVFPLLKIIGDPEPMEGAGTLGSLLDSLGIADTGNKILALCLLMAVLIVAKNLFMVLLVNFQSSYVWDARRDLSARMFSFYLGRDFQFHLNRNSAELIRNISISTDQVFGKFVLPCTQILTESICVLFILGILMAIEPVLTLVVVGALGALAAAFYALMQGRIQRAGLTVHETSSHKLRAINQSLSAITEIKSFKKEGYFEGEFLDAVTRNSFALKKYQAISQYPRLFLESLAALLMLSAIATMVMIGMSLSTALPLIGVFAMAAVRLMPAANRIVSAAANIRFVGPALDRILADTRSHVAIGRAHREKGPVQLRSSRSDFQFRHEVRFDGVTFRFQGAKSPSLTDVSFRVPKGHSVAFVGPSGAGKTTVANLLLGLLRPSAGRILIDDHLLEGDIAEAWQRKIAYIPQDAFLLDETIRRNIAFGVPDPLVDDKRLWKAVRLARLDEFLARAEGGIDAIIGEKGARISGGERQRMGIARALYHDAEVLVLDEATSSLDSTTESKITEIMGQLSGKQTTILIAHRLSTITHCDNILVFDKGRLIGQGPFEELERENAVFRDMLLSFERRSRHHVA